MVRFTPEAMLMLMLPVGTEGHEWVQGYDVAGGWVYVHDPLPSRPIWIYMVSAAG